MKLYVLFAQRKCSYEGEFAPEALAVADEFSYDDNPDYLAGELANARQDAEFVGAEIIEVNLGSKAMETIRQRLTGIASVTGTIVP